MEGIGKTYPVLNNCIFNPHSIFNRWLYRTLFDKNHTADINSQTQEKKEKNDNVYVLIPKK